MPRIKFGSDSGGFMLLSPSGKRFKGASKPVKSRREAMELAAEVAYRLKEEGRKDSVYVVRAVASVKANNPVPAPPPIEVVEFPDRG